MLGPNFVNNKTYFTILYSRKYLLGSFEIEIFGTLIKSTITTIPNIIRNDKSIN